MAFDDEFGDPPPSPPPEDAPPELPSGDSDDGTLFLPIRSSLQTAPVDPLDDDSHAVIYRYAISGGGGEVDGRADVRAAVARESVIDFFYPHTLESGGAKKKQETLDWLNQRRDVFLLAFQAVQALNADDKWSFYQIAGIHGLPHITYDGDVGSWDESNPEWWGGYCQHGTPLFPTWHRPYVMLLEQSIIRQAKRLASTLSQADEQQTVLDIAEHLRFPYWDCASQTTQVQGLPEIFTTAQVTLAYTWKSFSTTSIPNPLKAFVLPVSLGKPYTSSDVFNPTAKPNYVVPSGTPFIPQYYPTVRHVDAAYLSQTDKIHVALLRNASTTLVEGVHAVFQHTEWLPFSNHYWSEETHGDGTQYGHYTSLELVHDYVHTYIGGAGGQMAYPETAAFDPIFFFHHCNVDRLFALWQYCRPKALIPTQDLQMNSDGTFTDKPGADADSHSPLTPFRRTQEGEDFVKSTDVWIVDADCGYTYPELLQARKENWSPARMLHYVLKLYEPPQTYLHRWVMMVERVLKRAFNGPFSIRVFIGMPTANAKTATTVPNYAGAISIFARSSGVRCANCDDHKYMRGSLDLSKTMVRLGITTAAVLNTDLSQDDGTPPPNPFTESGSVTLVFVDIKGNALDPFTAIAGWEGPKVSLYYQIGTPVEQAGEIRIENFSPHVVHKFTLSDAQAMVAQSK